MKKLIPFTLILLIMACSKPAETDSELNNDTIQTASGLRYVYLKRGEGRKVEKGSMLGTKLSLMVEDSVVWNTHEEPDSLFTFVAGVGGVIKGFDEMALLMREGDNVLAILPDSLAYGDKGTGDVIPPNATLVYDRYEIVSVSEPRKVSIDTLYQIISNEGVEALKAQFEIIVADTAIYHAWGDYNDMMLISKVRRDSLYNEAFELANYLGTLHDDPDVLANMGWIRKEQGLIKPAIDTLESIMIRYSADSYDKESFEEALVELREMLVE
jgi:hypothetical protein